MLTPEGVEWVRARGSVIDSLGGGSELKAHRQRVLKQLAKVRKHHVFLDYLEDPVGFAPAIGDLADLARCRVDAAPGVWNGRFEALEVKAISAGQQDMVDFVQKCRDAYDVHR